MIQLFDSKRVHAPDFIIDHPVLGHRSVAPNIIAWAAKNKPGTQFTRETPWGLVVVAIADEVPRVQLYVKNQKLRDWLRGWGPTLEILLESYGVKLAGPLQDGRTVTEPCRSDEMTLGIALPLGNGDYRLVGISRPAVTEEVSYLGCILLTEAGFFFAGPEEPEAQKYDVTHTTPVPQAPRKTTTRQTPRAVHTPVEVAFSAEMSADEAEAAADAWERDGGER